MNYQVLKTDKEGNTYLHDKCDFCGEGFKYGKVLYRGEFNKYLCASCNNVLKERKKEGTIDEVIRTKNLYTTKTIRELKVSRKPNLDKI